MTHPSLTSESLEQLAIPSEAAEILRFWLFESKPKQWFTKDLAFDDAIRARFGGLVDQLLSQATAGDGLHLLDDWVTGPGATPESALAAILLLDQFPRNLYRNDATAFALDPYALEAANHMLAQERVEKIAHPARFFVLMPLEHSEDLADQDRCVTLMKELAPKINLPDLIDYAIQHRDIIARFGRFPHRNAALGRPSSAEERAFLQQPGSSF